MAAGVSRNVTIVKSSDNPANGHFYDPASLTVTAGGTVVWFNADLIAHTVTSTTNAFDSGNPDSGGVYKYAFSQSGSFEYYCKYHTWMTGKVVVQST